MVVELVGENQSSAASGYCSIASHILARDG